MKKLLIALSFITVMASCNDTVGPETIPLSAAVEIYDCSEYGASDGKIDVTITGGIKPYSFNWSNGEKKEDLENIGAGTYQLSVADGEGNTLSESYTVNTPAKTDLVLSLDVENCSAFNAADGKITLSVIGGLKPYSFLWSNGTTSQNLMNVAAGTYSVIVTDAEGLSKNSSAEITQPMPASIELSSVVKPASGPGIADGFIDLTVTGGVAPYSYSWSGGETTEDIFQLIPGDYIITVTDALDSSKTETITVGQYETGTVTDSEGNVYKTIKIGEQWWMAENLSVTNNPAGDSITSYIYDDDESNLENYGRLYSWTTAMDGATAAGARGIAPEGWHIPTRAEWNELFDYLGGIAAAGGRMKEEGTTHWQDPNVGATNLSGFNGRGSGERAGANENYVYQFKHRAGIYWTSEGNGANAFYFVLTNDKKSAREIYFHTDYAYSIRCIKD